MSGTDNLPSRIPSIGAAEGNPGYPTKAPVISYLGYPPSPVIGIPGETVTLAGSNLGPLGTYLEFSNNGITWVSEGGPSGSPTLTASLRWDGTGSFIVPTPDAAGHQVAYNTQASITVYATEKWIQFTGGGEIGAANWASAPATFMIAPPPPIITSISPATVGYGDIVTVDGENFLGGGSGVALSLNGGQYNLLVSEPITSTQITASVDYVSPPVTYGAPPLPLEGTIVVITEGGSSNSVPVSLKPPPAPMLTSATPSENPAGSGDYLKISGENFIAYSIGGYVTFSDTKRIWGSVGSPSPLSLTVYGFANTELTFVVPPGLQPGALATITVTTSGGTSNTLNVPLEPGISGASPLFGATGVIVTITGGGFAAGSTVRFGANTASNPAVTPQNISANGTAIMVAVPASATDGPIVVLLPDGTLLSGPWFTPAAAGAITPNSGTLPMFRMPGTQVHILGTGFAPGSTVTFGAGQPVVPDRIAADGSFLDVILPRFPDATSGPVTINLPGGAQLQAGLPQFPFAVDNFRNTRGYSWGNPNLLVSGSWSFDDATAVFGASQTVLADPFGLFQVDDPLVWIYIAFCDAALDSLGVCFGMCLSALEFVTGQGSLQLDNFPQQAASVAGADPSAPSVWMLAAAAGSDALATLVHQRHMAQFCQEGIDNFLNALLNITSAADLRSAIISAFTAGGAQGVGAIIAINPKIGEGHAVIAYDVVDKDDGAFDIMIYNPNVPFTTDEDTPGGSSLATDTTFSVISVSADGSWKFSIGPGVAAWSGGFHNLTVIPWNTIGLQPTFPFEEVIFGTLYVVAIVLVVADASVTQVSDGKGHELFVDGQWNINPDTVLTDVRAMPSFGGSGKTGPFAIVSRRPDLYYTVSGSRSGKYSVQWLGSQSGVVMTDVPTVGDAVDTLVMGPASVHFLPDRDVPLNVKVVGKSETTKLPRTAILKTTASAGASVTFSFEPTTETLRYVHAGAAAEYTIELSSHDIKGNPTTRSLRSRPVAPGEAHTISPDWTDLANGEGRVTVTNGIVTLTYVGRRESRADIFGRSRNMLSACLLLPDVEGFSPNCTIGIRGHQVSARMEVAMDKRVSRKETLSLFQRFESLHLALSTPCRTV